MWVLFRFVRLEFGSTAISNTPLGITNIGLISESDIYSTTHVKGLCAGGMLGPLLFGYAIDHSCLLWEKKCDGSTGTCVYYDNHDIAWLMFAVCVFCKVLSTMFGLLAWRLNESQNKKLSYCWETVRRESMPRIAEMDVEMTT